MSALDSYGEKHPEDILTALQELAEQVVSLQRHPMVSRSTLISVRASEIKRHAFAIRAIDNGFGCLIEGETGFPAPLPSSRDQIAEKLLLSIQSMREQLDCLEALAKEQK